MIANQFALLRRELLEHRSIVVVPAVVGLLMTLVWLTGQVTVNQLDVIDLGIIGATNIPEAARSVLLGAIMFLQSTPFIIVMWILTIFYALDSLYAERKDRSILFWRSMPVTDFETVLSKLLTAMIVRATGQFRNRCRHSPADPDQTSASGSRFVAAVRGS